MIPVDRLQAYLRHIAHRQYDTTSVPPFTLFFHPSDTLIYFNYAIPDEPTPTVPGQNLRQPLAALRATFVAQDRQLIQSPGHRRVVVTERLAANH